MWISCLRPVFKWIFWGALQLARKLRDSPATLSRVRRPTAEVVSGRVQTHENQNLQNLNSNRLDSRYC